MRACGSTGIGLSQDDPAASCQDIENVIALGPVDASQFEATVRQINAIGYTPITTSMQLAAQTLVDQVGARNTIVLVSDGEETCGGSPCLMAQALKAANIELTVNTIGFAADDVTRQQLQCIAEVTGGTYYDAPDAQQLGEALQAAVAPPGSVQIVDEAGNELSDVAFRLEATDSGVSVGDFVGSTSVAARDYRVLVDSDPPVDSVITVVSDETTFVVVQQLTVTGIQMVNLSGELL
ncbi:MAG TPA: VWA domain-containing protein, partial [Candidatus Limnocylindrales bacterium]|nr:VWA domain-containing protein [Candidatus Limnocylindrales bacterium]